MTKQRQEAEQSVANRFKNYERMLQLGNHEVAAELLREIQEISLLRRTAAQTEREACKQDRNTPRLWTSTQELRQDTQEPSTTTPSTEHDI